MYGQKQILQLLLVAVLVSLFNFYRQIIRNENELKSYRLANHLKAKEEEALLLKKTEEVNNTTKSNRIAVSEQFLEYSDKCYPVQIFLTKSDEIVNCDGNNQNVCNECIDKIKTKQNCCKTLCNDDTTHTNNQLKCVKQNNKCDKLITCNRNNNNQNKCLGSSSSVISKSIKSKRRLIKGATSNVVDEGKTSEKYGETSNVLTYVIVLILFLSLIKAALDVSKHIKERRNDMDDNDLRRCSLQEYSLIKHHNNNNSNNKRKSLPKIASLVPQTSVDSSCNNPVLKEQARRMSTNPQDYRNGSGITTEPGSPAKPGKLLAGRPAPLLRRCSVPVFVKQYASKYSGDPRRPSMDSVSEDDSSPDVKRRVRMIHRH